MTALFCVVRNFIMPSIILPENLSPYVNGAVKLTFHFKFVSEAITYLEKHYPNLYSELFNSDGTVKINIHFYLNSIPITDQIREPITISENDCFEIVMS